MKDYIERLISEQYTKLREQLKFRADNNMRCCDLKNVSFTSDENPDYTNLGQKSLYLLRYGPAYTIEYYKAYEKILIENYLQGANFSIASLGCGAYIDKVSAFYALNDYNTAHHSDLKIALYIGIDSVDWGEDVICDVIHSFIHKNIERLVPADFSEPVNILIFPKSLPEISEYALDRFLQSMNVSCFQNRICIILSIRNSSEDITKCKEFISNFCNTFPYKSISMNKICNLKHQDEDRYKYIWELYHFSFPQDAINLSTNIYKNCWRSSFSDEECSSPQPCNKLINKCPMFSSEYFNTFIYCLERI